MKVSGSLESLLRGVSEQSPDNRLPGQCGEQVNLIPDPVSGLVRRHGSQFVSNALLPGYDVATSEQDLRSFRVFQYEHDGETYDVLVRRAARPIGGTIAAVLVRRHSDGVFLPVSPSWAAAWETGGISAITSIGKFVVMAGNTVLPAKSTVDDWSATDGRAAVWVRGSAYSRTFTVRAVRTDDAVFNFSYTTPSSSYQGILDTSGVPALIADSAGGTTTATEQLYITAVGAVARADLSWEAWNPTGLSLTNGGAAMTNVHPATPTTTLQYAWAAGLPVTLVLGLVGSNAVKASYTHTKTVANPNYTKIVADLTSEYNSAVTNWIGTAAAAIQPAAVAESLRLAANVVGLTTGTVVGSTLLFNNVRELVVGDGGDGTLIRGVDNEVASIDQVSTVHFVGKVVKVRPTDAPDYFYLKAEAIETGATGAASVRWIEGGGQTTSITSGFALGVVSGGTFYITDNLVGPVVSGPFTDRPAWVTSTVGDETISPAPFFIGKRITFLDVFQDRLIIGCRGVVRASRIGDYFNMFRASMLTVLADDPFEVTSLGNESDVITYGVKYDQNLMLFGANRQYVLPGRLPLSPTNALLPVISSHKGAADTAPVEAGGLVFYAKHGDISSSVWQIEPGRNPESPEAYPISDHISRYIAGKTAELLVLSKPTALVVRSAGAPNTLYVYSYLDAQDGRKQGAWHKFEYNTELGSIIGLSSSPRAEGFFIYFSRPGAPVPSRYVTCDYQPMVAGLSRLPYLDSQVPWPGSITAIPSATQWAAAFDDQSIRHNVGAFLPDASDLIAAYPGTPGLRAGALFPSYWVPTNPTPIDQRGRAILTGECTVTQMYFAVTDCGGFTSAVNGDVTYTFNGRIVGNSGNLIGRAPRATGTVVVPVGHERRRYEHKIQALNWQPMSITSINWVGQLFNRSPRL